MCYSVMFKKAVFGKPPSAAINRRRPAGVSRRQSLTFFLDLSAHSRFLAIIISGFDGLYIIAYGLGHESCLIKMMII